jgi:RimJ/RimL family protein N-acetyltransferase/predicted nucleotidyltransferase
MVIETERLILRPLGRGDFEQLVALHREPAVVEFLGAVTPENVAERVVLYERAWQERGHDLMAIIERSNGRFLGRAGLKYWPQFGETEVGWALFADAQGHGYATEAARGLLRWGFATFPFPYITAMIRPDNSRSLGVAGRLGMEVIREDVMFGVPVVAHASSREEWTDLALQPEERVAYLLDRVSAWAGSQPDLVGVAVVGSWARGGARADSDLDLVFLSWDPERYVEQEDWAHELGASEVLASAHRGMLVEQRLKMAWGPELDVGIGSPRWASLAPLHPGTARVARAGLRIVHDAEGMLAGLKRGVGSS